MYTMALDSVREHNVENIIMAETSLMRSALMGNPVILTPNQAMDSLALQDIILNNNTSNSQKNPFCTAVSKGLVRVAMPREPRVYRGLVDYCFDALQRGLNEPDHEFIISGLKFLYQKESNGNEVHPYTQRCEILRYISIRLENMKRRYSGSEIPAWLTTDEKRMVEEYIESIILLDNAVSEYEDFVYQKKLFVLFLSQQIAERLKLQGAQATVSLLNVLHQECSKPYAPIYRSYYYRFISKRKSEFGTEAYDEAKTIIDIAYNKTMALSVGTNTELNIPSSMKKLSKSIISQEKPISSVQNAYRYVSDIEGVNWDMMLWIYDEINAVMCSKGCTWMEAAGRILEREKKVPLALNGKFFVFNAIKISLSNLFPVTSTIIEFITSLLTDELGSWFQDKFEIPGSIKESRQRIKKAGTAMKMLDDVIVVGQGNRI